jgi:hypothetical protein
VRGHACSHRAAPNDASASRRLERGTGDRGTPEQREEHSRIGARRSRTAAEVTAFGRTDMLRPGLSPNARAEPNAAPRRSVAHGRWFAGHLAKALTVAYVHDLAHEPSICRADAGRNPRRCLLLQAGISGSNRLGIAIGSRTYELCYPQQRHETVVGDSSMPTTRRHPGDGSGAAGGVDNPSSSTASGTTTAPASPSSQTPSRRRGHIETSGR